MNCFASEMILRCLGIMMPHSEMINNFKEINSEIFTWATLPLPEGHCVGN